MWLCTKLGFYSIVQKTPKEVHLRARAEQDLVNLRLHCTCRVPLASSWKIHRTDVADYRWRIVIAPGQLPKIMSVLADSLDYSNFKGIISTTPDQSDKIGIYSAFHHDLEDWQHRNDSRPNR